VRLDHLLSKEQHVHGHRDTRKSDRGVAGLNIRSWCCLVAQGIVELLVMVCGYVAGKDEYCFFGSVESVVLGVVVGCSLAHCWVLRQHAGVVSGVVFENCRVDASIFVVKLLRAHGGCLGIRSR
jgi:hypothetical protein